MGGAIMTTEKLDDIMHAIRVFETLAGLAEESAKGQFGQWFPELRRKWEKQASRRRRAVKRLKAMLIKECDRIKADIGGNYIPDRIKANQWRYRDYEPEQAYGSAEDLRTHLQYGGTREDY